MLTRKHFKAIAEILREHKADGVLVRDIADFCYNSNSNFDRGRFYDACDLELQAPAPADPYLYMPSRYVYIQ